MSERSELIPCNKLYYVIDKIQPVGKRNKLNIIISPNMCINLVEVMNSMILRYMYRINEYYVIAQEGLFQGKI